MSQIGHKSQQENKRQQAEYHCLAENPQEQMFTREIIGHMAMITHCQISGLLHVGEKWLLLLVLFWLHSQRKHAQPFLSVMTSHCLR